MYYSQRLKNDNRITGLIPAMVVLFISVLTGITFGMRAGFLAVSTFFILYACFSLYIYFRTVNLSYLVAALWQFLVGLYVLSRPKLRLVQFFDERLAALIYFFVLATTVWLLYLYFKRKAKWKGREIFELASMKIETEKNGFTNRPRPSGKAEFTVAELKGFAFFLQKNLISMPFLEINRILFVPVKMGDEFNFILGPEKFRDSRSWIAFDFNGNVTVNIARRDYLDYREELSFDELCENMGALFIEFLEYYKRGEEERIVYKLDELGLGLTS